LKCILLHTTFPSATVFSFYIFTFLMFRKINKSQLTNIKQQNCIGIRAYDSRLYLDISRSFWWKESVIFRYFKIFQGYQIFTCGLSDLLSCGQFVGCFYVARILVSSEHKLCQIWNTCLVSCIYSCILINFLESKLLIFIQQSLLSRVMYTNYRI
jgi:hypothetical protein